jgi:hypothetical protein
MRLDRGLANLDSVQSPEPMSWPRESVVRLMQATQQVAERCGRAMWCTRTQRTSECNEGECRCARSRCQVRGGGASQKLPGARALGVWVRSGGRRGGAGRLALRRTRTGNRELQSGVAREWKKRHEQARAARTGLGFNSCAGCCERDAYHALRYRSSQHAQASSGFVGRDSGGESGPPPFTFLTAPTLGISRLTLWPAGLQPKLMMDPAAAGSNDGGNQGVAMLG